VRIVLVCALVILLALIAMREVQGITATAGHPRAAAGGPATWSASGVVLAVGKGDRR
jgi:hypothetical protein